MSVSALKIVTDGYLKQGAKAVLVIAASGYLNFTEIIPPVTDEGGGGSGRHNSSTKTLKKEEKQNLLKAIQIEDSEIIAIVEACLKTTII